MPDVALKIRDKIAKVQGSPQIVCGNSDYAVTMEFDAEWNDYDAKTLHIVWLDVRTGEMRHYDVQFSGGTAMLPAIYNADRVYIGVYAGDIRTTTPACVPCARCITDGDPYHDDPPPDIYEQLMAYMEEIIEGGGGGGGTSPSGTLTRIISGSVGGFTGMIPVISETDMMQYTWEQGSSSTTTGDFNLNSSNRIRCRTFLPIPSGAMFMRTAVLSTSNAKLYYRPYWYSGDSAANYLFCDGFAYSDQAVNVPEGATHVRLVLSKTESSGTAITPSQLGACDVTFC